MSLLYLLASAFISATLFPGTSEVLLGTLLLEDEHAPALLVAIATVGNLAGGLVNWVLGYYFSSYADRRWFPIKPSAYYRIKGWFERFGVWTLLFAWLPIIGDPITIAAGLFRIKLFPFVLLVTIGKVARYSFIAGVVFAATA